MEILKNSMDSLNLGAVLSRIDGIGNYDGLIIIATTNFINKLDSSLFRELRLTPYYFTYSRTIDIINMTEKFFECKLTDEEIKLLPDRIHKITPAKIRSFLEKYETNKCDFLRYLNQEINETKVSINETKVSINETKVSINETKVSIKEVS